MKELFVTYELAKRLFEKGFDETCFGFYSLDGNLQIEQVSSQAERSGHGIKDWDGKSFLRPLAPMHQQVIDWLRGKHNIRIKDTIATEGWSSKGAESDYRFDVIRISGLNTNSMLKYSNMEGRSFATYYEALNAAIDFALTNIMK